MIHAKDIDAAQYGEINQTGLADKIAGDGDRFCGGEVFGGVVVHTAQLEGEGMALLVEGDSAFGGLAIDVDVQLVAGMDGGAIG